jgi:UDP-glucose 4-epimerase
VALISSRASRQFKECELNQGTVVWGGTGFIGRHLVADLIRHNRPVTVLTRRPVSALPFAADPLLSAVQVPEGREGRHVLISEISSARTIFNLAGVSGAVASNRDFLASLDGNCRIQAEFLETCDIAGTRPHVVFASSRLVYGTPDSLPVNEEAPVQPTSAYAAHKLCVEHYHQIASATGSITYTICRISNPYGKTQYSVERGYGFISDLIQHGLHGQTLKLFGTGIQLRDYLHISDLIGALQLAATCPTARNAVFNIGCGRGISICDAALAIQDLTGARVEYSPWPEEYLKVESGDYVADISKARGAIGYEPRFDFTEGLKEVVRQHHHEVRQTQEDAKLLGRAMAAHTST